MRLVDLLSGPSVGVRKATEGVSKSLSDASTKAQKAAASIKAVEEAYTKMQKSLEVSQRLSFVGMEMSKIGNGLTSPLKASVAAAADFEESIKAVGLVTRGTSEEIEQLRQQALLLGSTTEFSTLQVAEGMRYLGRAGFTTKEILSGLPGVMDMADAAGADLAATSAMAADLVVGFGLSAADLPRVADVLTAAFTTSKTTLDQLGEALAGVAPLASEVGLKFEDAAAMVALLGNAGIKGSAADRAIRSMMANLANSTGPAADLVSELNLDLLDMEGNLRSPVAILGEMADAMKDMGSGERLAALSTIFDQRSAGGLAKLMKDAGSGGILAYAKTLNESTGAAGRAAAQMDTAKDGFDRLTNAVSSLRAAFGTSLLPVVNLFAKILGGLAAALMRFTEKHRTWALILGLSVAIIGGLASAIGGLASAFAGLYGSYQALSFASQWLSIKTGIQIVSFRTLSATMMGGLRKALLLTVSALARVAVAGWAAIAPFWPIIAVAALVAGAAFLIIKFWGPISAFFISLWGGIKVGAVKVWEALKFAFGFSPLGMIIKNWDPIVKYFRGLWDKIGGVIERMSAPFKRFAASTTVSAMAGAAVTTAPLPMMAGMPPMVSIERTISAARAESGSRINAPSQINAPITIHAALGQSEEAIGLAVVQHLDRAQRDAEAQQRARLYE
jgi:TP901 family phage tail tape measure protein